MSKRQAISKKTRFLVFKRDLFTCQYCGAHPPDVVLEPDHILPVAAGGKNDINNLATACFACNRGKSDGLLSDIPQSLSSKRKGIEERAEQMRGYVDAVLALKEQEDRRAWAVVNALSGTVVDSYPLNYLTSIRSFLSRLSFEPVMDAAEIANQKGLNQRRTFLYFSSICWRLIREGA